MSSPKMTATSGNGFIQFEFDERLLKVIEDALGDLKSESRKVLKNAVNKTAKQAKADLAQKAQETYVVKKGRFTKAMATKNATTGNPEAVIKVTGEQLELHDFKVSPATTRGKNRPDVVKAKVLLSSGLKPLTANTKAFLVTFQNTSKSGKSSSHTTVAQRYGKSRYPIKKLLSNSIPKMVGSQERVYGIVEPDIYDNLMANVQAEIRKVLKA